MIDLVIKNEHHMIYLLTFLVHTLKTTDGTRNSALKLQTDGTYDSLNEIYNATIRKYKLMKFKMKISCIAFEKMMSVK